MDETMEFTSHKCHEPRPTVREKLDSLLVWIDIAHDTSHDEVDGMILS
jgi:hypothetical protein